MQPLHFANRLELMRAFVKMVFGEARSTRRGRAVTPPTRPAWYRYEPRPSPIWKKFSPEERERAKRHRFLFRITHLFTDARPQFPILQGLRAAGV